MIAPPLNDHQCLGPTTDQIRAEVDAANPSIVDLAAQFKTTDDLACWFRTLPQRDDNGSPEEEPKIDACRPPQRLQLDSLSPNCFERAARFIGAAELIEPEREYRLATVSTPNGLHTFPTRDGEPVILDPIVRNVADGTSNATRRLRIERLVGLDERKGVRGDLASARRAKALGHTTWVDGKPIDDAIATYEHALARYRAILADLEAQEAADDGGKRNRKARNAEGSNPVMLTPVEAIDWIVELASVRADRVIGGMRRIDNGRKAMRGVLVMRPICVADIRDVALVLALAEREARALGIGALRIVHSTARAIDALDQLAAQYATNPPRNASIASLTLGSLAGNKELQQLVGGLARVAGRIAGGIGLEAARVKLASVGVGSPVITAVERELNREGLTLGPLAKPSPIIGSLDAMTPQALAGRWLAQKLS